MLVTLALLLTAASPMKLAAPGLSCANLDEKVANSFLVHFGQQLGLQGISVISPQEVSAVIGIERQKQLVGCQDDATNCAVEMANALGVDGIIVGTISKVGSGYLLNLKIIRARDASTLAIYSGRPKSDDAVLDFIEASAKQFGAQLHGEPASASVTSSAADEPRTGASGMRVGAFVVGGAAVVALAAGGVLFGLSKSTAAKVGTGAAQTPADFQALIGTGRAQETDGLVILGVGGALAVTSAVLFAVSGAPAKASVALVPGPGGATVTLSGSLP